VSQHAAIAAIKGPTEPIERMHGEFEKRRNYVVDRIAELPRISCPRPEGAFYAFVNIENIEGSSLDIAKRLLYDYGIVTVPGSGFGAAGEGYLRLSFATSLDLLEEGFDRIERLVQS
jgi:aspartate aminotransferase